MTFPDETPRWRRYLLFWRSNVKRDIDDELRFHLETRVEELTAQGMTEPAARRRALDEFGDVTDVKRGLGAIGQRISSAAHASSGWTGFDRTSCIRCDRSAGRAGWPPRSCSRSRSASG